MKLPNFLPVIVLMLHHHHTTIRKTLMCPHLYRHDQAIAPCGFARSDHCPASPSRFPYPIEKRPAAALSTGAGEHSWARDGKLIGLARAYDDA